MILGLRQACSLGLISAGCLFCGCEANDGGSELALSATAPAGAEQALSAAGLSADAIIGQDVADEREQGRRDAQSLGGRVTTDIVFGESQHSAALAVGGGSLWLADLESQRVLGWSNAVAASSNGAPADRVLFADDAWHSGNYHYLSPNFPTWPSGLAVTADGDLVVAPFDFVKWLYERLLVLQPVPTELLVFEDPFTSDGMPERRISGAPPSVAWTDSGYGTPETFFPMVVRSLSQNRLAVIGHDMLSDQSLLMFAPTGGDAILGQKTVTPACSNGAGVHVIDVAEAGDYIIVACDDGNIEAIKVETDGYPRPPLEWADPRTAAVLYQGMGFGRIAVASDYLFISQPAAHRVLRYPRLSQHLSDCFDISGCTPPAGPAPAPVGTTTPWLYPDMVFGQEDLVGVACNRALGVPRKSTLCGPEAVAVDDSGNLWVHDVDNYRILRFAGATGTSTDKDADGILGQPDYDVNRQNRLDPDSFLLPGAMAMTADGRVLIVDTVANRVVVFPSIAGIATKANTPSVVIGQPDTHSYTANYPDDPTNLTDGTPTSSNLSGPTHVAVGPDGVVYVTDAGNNRVLAYSNLNAPVSATKVFGLAPGGTMTSRGMYDVGPIAVSGRSLFVAVQSYPSAGPEPIGVPLFNAILRFDTADPAATPMVFGQPAEDLEPTAPGLQISNDCNYDGTHATTGARGPDNLCNVRGLAVDAEGRLWVADWSNNRVLWFDDATGSDRSSVIVADGVVGQPDFYSANSRFTDSTSPPNAWSILTPEGLAVTASGGLWVACLSDNRVLYFPTPRTAEQREDGLAGPRATIVLGQTSFAGEDWGVTADKLTYPASVVATADNHLVLVGDTDNARVLRFSLNQAPVITGGGDFTVRAGATLQVPLTVTDPDGDTVGALALASPAPANGALSGSTFTYDATDAAPGTEAAFVITAADTAAVPATGTTTLRVRVADRVGGGMGQPSTPTARSPKEIPDDCNNCNTGAPVAFLPWVIGVTLLRLLSGRRQGSL